MKSLPFGFRVSVSYTFLQQSNQAILWLKKSPDLSETGFVAKLQCNPGGRRKGGAIALTFCAGGGGGLKFVICKLSRDRKFVETVLR